MLLRGPVYRVFPCFHFQGRGRDQDGSDPSGSPQLDFCSGCTMAARRSDMPTPTTMPEWTNSTAFPGFITRSLPTGMCLADYVGRKRVRYHEHGNRTSDVGHRVRTPLFFGCRFRGGLHYLWVGPQCRNRAIIDESSTRSQDPYQE